MYDIPYTDRISGELRSVKDKALGFYSKRDLMYGEYPYKLHIDGCLSVFRKYEHLIGKYYELVECAIYFHDTLEDCAITYNDIINVFEPSYRDFGKSVADIVYDVTNELGKNRKERSERTYPKIAKNDLAVFVKLCDRIANVSFSHYIGSSMLDAYKKEYKYFKECLYNKKHGYDDMWKELDDMLL